VHAPASGPAHGAKGWHIVVVTVTITVIALACADVSPAWLSAAAAMVGVLLDGTQRSRRQ
jgi:hypothetical protein